MTLDVRQIHLLAEWLGHDFDAEEKCVFCNASPTELSQRADVPVCDGGRRSAAVHRAMHAMDRPRQARYGDG